MRRHYQNDNISHQCLPFSIISRYKNTRSGAHHEQIENILRLTPDWPPILATPSDEDCNRLPEVVLVNETKNDYQATRNDL